MKAIASCVDASQTLPPCLLPPCRPAPPPQARILSWFVYAATLLLLASVVVLVVLKYKNDERSTLFETKDWCAGSAALQGRRPASLGRPPRLPGARTALCPACLRAPAPLPFKWRPRWFQSSALQLALAASCGPQLGPAPRSRAPLWAGIHWNPACPPPPRRYVVNAAMAGATLLGLLGLAAWFAANMLSTREGRHAWSVRRMTLSRAAGALLFLEVGPGRRSGGPGCFRDGWAPTPCTARHSTKKLFLYIFSQMVATAFWFAPYLYIATNECAWFNDAVAWLALLRWTAYNSCFLWLVAMAHGHNRYRGPHPRSDPDEQVCGRSVCAFV